MSYDHFTAIGGELIQRGDIVRIPHHGAAWPAMIDSTGRSVTVRPLARNGWQWDAPRRISADDCWFHITPSEARALELPKVAV